MTRKRPPGMSQETWIDKLIREAEQRGEFDNLPGAGKPIPGLDKPYDELWWVKQLLVREKLSLTPATLALRKDVEETLRRIGRAKSEETVRRLVEEINARIAEVNRKVTSGPPSTLAPLDPDAVVRRWRAGNVS
ncbi:MAG: DnaJ family domain-containing protein [Planctomycetota bacterium]